MDFYTSHHSPADPIETLKAAATSWDPTEWKKQLPKLTPNEIAELVPLASEFSNREDWKEILETFFFVLDNQASLEAAGNRLNSDQFLEILSIVSHAAPKEKEKLSSLLITLPAAVFKETLSLATTEDLELLKGEAFGEPLLHQISLLTRELEQEIDTLTDRAIKFGDDLENLSLTSLDGAETNALFASIEVLTANVHEVIDLLRNAQKVAWIADRADLIEDLSKARELAQRTLIYIIGDKDKESDDETALWSKLHKKINLLFSDINDQEEITFMHDTQPVLDAIVKFSIWYLNDYEEVGILPKGSIDALENASSDEERQTIRKALYDSATANLSKLGLDTLYDLKQARLFSKTALKEYLSAHRI